MSQLPRAAHATLADAKIARYLLNTTHVDGAAKARFFALFGFSVVNSAELKKALLDHPLHNPVTDRRRRTFGELFEVSCSLVTPDGRNPCIISVWIIEPPNQNPRFITAYPNQ